ncbi:cell wall metabolism sensor histidine kinase WalK [Alkalihalobacillus pseudalcaliphilus]|uniref:cell wall metabolism sensor histidine kinase WalK n=1 Tax=Alkalihalobacillus pseudalcaliphilus TaxID=79884 RepID=UPI00064DF3E6|nr:cell wall metabolism sensor histidine kinase WalK [Alkalihalobacillus pseudalcaliphilus]KMK77938.1 histidine kinase [Alkalihalobacillus pseudalcaliphilus]
MKSKVGFFKSIQFKLIIIYVLLILIAMQVIGVYFTKQLEDQLNQNHLQMLQERADFLAYNLAQIIPNSDSSSIEVEVNSLLRDLFDVRNPDVLVVDANQVVIGTSDISKRNIIGQQTNDVFIKRALVGTTDEGNFVDAQGNIYRSLVVPIMQRDNVIVGALQIQAPMDEIYDQMEQINGILLSGTTIALGITIILIVLVSQTITRPILDMRKQAMRMGHGDFSRKVRVFGSDEIGQLATSFNDLTSKLQDAITTRDREQKKLSSVLGNMTDGVIATDENGLVILMNKRAEELLGKATYEVIRKPITEVLKLSEVYHVNDLFDHDESLILDFSDDENAYMLQASFSVIQENDGPINGVITVLHDVTEQEQIEQDRREFVANVSHELRTPLTTMKSYLEALEDGAIEDQELGRRFLGVTQNETERMIRLVNDLLQLSKIDSRDYKLNLTTVDFGLYLHEVVDRFDMIAVNKNIHFTREITPKNTYVKMDRDKLTQVIDNIISNAMKYSPEGGNVTIRMEHYGKQIRVSIQDQGMGIPRESQQKIFDRFYRVDKARARSIGGTGLGLAIAKELVQAHSGEIWVESMYGKGTTIFFTLPFEKKKGGNK